MLTGVLRIDQQPARRKNGRSDQPTRPALLTEESGGERRRGTQGGALDFPLVIARMEALVAIWLVGGGGK